MEVNNAEIQRVLEQMRAVAAEARGPARMGPEEGEGADFGALLKQSLDTVSATQAKAGDMAKALERGDPNVDLAEVMVALEKSSISFQALSQVRNRLVQAYRDIKNMPI